VPLYLKITLGIYYELIEDEIYAMMPCLFAVPHTCMTSLFLKKKEIAIK